MLKNLWQKGDKIVEMNYKAIDEGADKLIQVKVDKEWANLEDEIKKEDFYKGSEFVENIVKPMNAARGDDLPVSAFWVMRMEVLKQELQSMKKRGVGVTVPNG